MECSLWVSDVRDESWDMIVAALTAAGAKHGFRRGDVLMQVYRKPIENPKDLKKALADAKKDGKTSVPVLVRRGDVQQFSTLPVA